MLGVKVALLELEATCKRIFCMFLPSVEESKESTGHAVFFLKIKQQDGTPISGKKEKIS